MAKVDEGPLPSPAAGGSPNQTRNSGEENRNGCRSPGNNAVSVTPGTPCRTEEFISCAAANLASQPVVLSDPDVWGVLTAISDKARKRSQGIHMLLTSDEHCIGRLVDDAEFQIISPAVSARHCMIYRKTVASKDTQHTDCCFSVFLKDTSTNGTYLNGEKLSKRSSEVKLSHGDIISIAFTPQHDLAYAFVFREVKTSSTTLSPNLTPLKRKQDGYASESKRLKGIGIGASDGPVSLDDFRSLQRSNMDLRKLLEDKVATIEVLRNENHMVNETHESEMRELKESVSKPYVDKIFELNQTLEAKDKELAELNRVCSERKHEIESLNQRFVAFEQSSIEANEIIVSQKISISELKALLDEEREQRREERDKSSMDMKITLQKVQAESAEEIKRISDSALKREKELQDLIDKLQEAEKERCLRVETLRSKLEDTRQKLVDSDNKVRQLECQISQEQEAAAMNRKKFEELELEVRRLRRELENEKAAREEAWGRVSALELQISAAMSDLDYERQRLKGARERIMLRETQLRAFYSTTEEIQVLFAKQQEQLKAMQKTLEDEENYEGTSMDVDLNLCNENENPLTTRNKTEFRGRTIAGKVHVGGRVSSQEKIESSSDEASATEKLNCAAKIQHTGEDTQEVDSASEHVNATDAFGSDVNGFGTAPAFDDNAVGTELIADTEGVGTVRIMETEHVSETESQGRHIDLNRVGEDNQMIVGNSQDIARETCNDHATSAAAHDPVIDTDGGETIRTADLLASEVVGSWACSTAPDDSGSVVADSQPSSRLNYKSYSRDRRNQERRALTRMIGIVAPDLREQFSASVESEEQGGSDTQECSGYDNDEKLGGGPLGFSSEGDTHDDDDDEVETKQDESAE